MRSLKPEFLSIDTESTRATRTRVEGLARLLDSTFNIGGIRFGWDSILGLVPVLGDTISMVLSFYIVSEAARAGASKVVLSRMISNIATDTVVGAVPIAGDLFDVAFKSNRRNAAILLEHLDAPEKMRRQSKVKLALLIGGFILAGILLLSLTLLISAWIARKLGILNS